MGTDYGIYPCGSALVMGKIDSQDDASSEQPCVYVYIIYCAVVFFAAHGEGATAPRSTTDSTE
jgi:hypothetical protein